METKKRKTKTSSEVKRRYNKKNYSAITAMIPIETAEKFRKKCVDDGISQAQIIKKAIEDFLNQ